jgi:AcrR family transcriptional regulator
MPMARESLLRAAEAALAARPWPAVRMVEVAAAAGVSRQTLYNEFGGKAGLGRALVRRAADEYLDGVDRALCSPAAASGAERLAAVAEWTVRAARAHPLVRALLTGAWGPALPPPSADGRRPVLAPGELTREVRDRAAAALPQEPARRCELAVRLALSYVVAPAADPAADELLRLLSGPSRTAGGR